MTLSQAESPKYLTLSRQLKREIKSGRYQPGQPIPTVQELVARHGVSRNTVRQAIALLEDEHYLERRQGSGTYVKAMGASGQPLQALESILLLIVDGVWTHNGYNMRQVYAAQQWADQRGISLAAANLVTEELLQGRRPPVVKKGGWQAVLFDGAVTDLHCQIAHEMGVPYVIVGNHRVSPRRPQVRGDLHALTRQMADYLDTLRPGQPLALIVEPFELHLSLELFTAYSELVQRRGQKNLLLGLAPGDQARDAAAHLLDTAGQSFSLITTNMLLNDIIAVYRQRGVNPMEHPICTIAPAEDVALFDRRYSALAVSESGTLVTEALSLFEESYRQGMTGELFRVVDSSTIIPMLDA